jgi:cytosolic 5'-nucleotidase 3
MPEKSELFDGPKVENIIISNKERFGETEKRFREGGLGNVHVLADFDRTLTRAYADGVEVPSVISILRDGHYLTSDYAAKAHELYDKYSPLEKDPGLSQENRKRLMEEWWTKHFALLIQSGLKKEDIAKAVKSGKIKFREGFSELADFLQSNNIPLVILSSSGLGKESILLKLKEEGIAGENIHVISNAFEWDTEGRAVATRKPIIHSANKDETLLKDYPAIFEAVKNRKNVILLGDSLDDLGMVEGFAYDNLLKIGFWNDRTKERESAYRESYDVLVLNDSSLDFINRFLGEIPK